MEDLKRTQRENNLGNEFLSVLHAIEGDKNLYQESNFNLRLEALDEIDFRILDRMDEFGTNRPVSDSLTGLKEYAVRVKGGLEEINTKLFRHLRKEISQGRYRGEALVDLIHEYPGYDLNKSIQQHATGYDHLDIFLNGLLTHQDIPLETKVREPEMVYYQKTPARIIFYLIQKAGFNSQDVFFDLGSGLGQVAMLISLLTSVFVKGVEFEPAFCRYAQSCAAELNLNNIEFINADARYADYSSGTVFFMYTPFEGKMLQDTLRNLENEAKRRQIKIFTYGPCTLTVARQGWLIKRAEIQNGPGAFGDFISA